jgi:aldehyde:ferredoxin oxidoreductase
MTTYGWVGKILKVNLTEGKTVELPTSDYVPKFLGGRGLGAKIFWDEVPPEVGAFDPGNVLVFATGPLQGTMAPTSGRFKVMGKAPQTGPVESYCHSGVGGHWAPELKWAGYDALVIKGQSPKPVYLFIDNEKVKILDAMHLWGLDTYETQKKIWATHGSGVRIMTIGPAGEKKSRIAIILTDTGDASGQGGFGGVMGSKNLKAIAVRGTGYVQVARPSELKEIISYVNTLFARKSSRGDPFKPEEPGFKYNIWGGGFARGSLGEAQGELSDFLNDPSSGYSRVLDGCFACPVICRSHVKGPDITPGVALCAQAYMYMESTVYDYKKGYSKVTWNAAKLADLYGINAYDIMAIIPWLDDCFREGLLTEKDTGLPLREIGSQRFIEALLQSIANRNGFGDLLAEGGQRAAAKIGGKAEERMQLYYTRSGKFGGYREHWGYLGGFPTGYALSYLALLWAMDNRDVFTSHNLMSQLWGAAHTIGQNPRTAVPEDLTPILRPVMKYAYGSEKAADFITEDGKRLNWEWAAKVVKRHQERSILKDSYIVCDIPFPFIFNPNTKDHVGDTSIESRLYSAVTGLGMSEEESYAKGDMLSSLERAIACRDGRTRQDDVLHERYYNNLDAAERKYGREDLENAKSEFYQLKGWQLTTGVPSRKKLQSLGLKEVADELENRGVLPKSIED